MGGGHFSVVRDPWRFHSAFAGLLQPHESMAGSMGGMGGGGGGMGGGVQQFHQVGSFLSPYFKIISTLYPHHIITHFFF